jgi:hypothetical protein
MSKGIGEEKEIPRNISMTLEEMKVRKQLDLRRWYCIARP